MTRAARLSVLIQLTLAVLPCTALAGAAPAARVVLHDHGEKIPVAGAEADEIVRLCLELVKRGADTAGGPSTDQWEAVRKDEVAVEVRFEEPQALELKNTKERKGAQNLLVPLTGEFTGPSGNAAYVMTGGSARKSDVPYVGLRVVNGPDEYGYQYLAAYITPDGLDDLRQAVAKLGVEAPRQQAPETTPDRSPMAIPPAKEE